MAVSPEQRAAEYLLSPGDGGKVALGAPSRPGRLYLYFVPCGANYVIVFSNCCPGESRPCRRRWQHARQHDRLSRPPRCRVSAVLSPARDGSRLHAPQRVNRSNPLRSFAARYKTRRESSFHSPRERIRATGRRSRTTVRLACQLGVRLECPSESNRFTGFRPAFATDSM
jgi:hypothetical protein